MNNKIIILCGKSGSGKDFILKNMVKNYNYTPIISTTSRPKRNGEQDGVDYFFVSEDSFLQMISNDKLLEYRSYNTCFDGNSDTWYYGLKKQELDKNKKYVIILDLNGAKSFVDYYGSDNCEVIYIDCPQCIRVQRAMKRGSFSKQEWTRRMFADEDDFDYNKRINIINRTVENWKVGSWDDKDIDDVIKEIVNGL